MPTRFRCTDCGNLTRFDVTTTRTIRAFHHYSIGGELTVESEEELAGSIDDVSCRWCGHGRSVEAFDPDSEVAGGDGEPGPAEVDSSAPR